MQGLFRTAVLCALASSLAAQPLVTIAGAVDESAAPVRGFSGDGAAAYGAALAFANLQNECDPGRFEQGSFLSFDASGNLYFADSSNHRIRRIEPAGGISTIAGSGDRPQTNTRCEPTSPPGDNGQASAARLYNPSAV